MSSLAQSSGEFESQQLASLFMESILPLYTPFFSDRTLLPQVISLIFAHTEGDESYRDSRIYTILEIIQDDETRYLALSHAVMSEKIFSSRLTDLYSEYIDSGMALPEFRPYAIHILRYISPIKPNLLQNHLQTIGELTEDDRPILQAALVQLLIDSEQEALLQKVIEHTDRIDILSLTLHLTTELGQISSPLLVALFKKIGPNNLENVCTERLTVETPVGSLQLGRITNSWNSAAVNAAVIGHVQSLPISQWDVEFSLCKLLLKQPMDSTSTQVWQGLFSKFAPQFGELMRDEESTEVIFDLLSFYLIATLDYSLLEKLLSCLEPVVTVSKEKCKIAGTKFLTRVAELGPRFKQIVGTLIQV